MLPCSTPRCLLPSSAGPEVATKLINSDQRCAVASTVALHVKDDGRCTPCASAACNNMQRQTTHKGMILRALQAGKPKAYFYLDPYSRPAEKRGGAWMAEVVGQVC